MPYGICNPYPIKTLYFSGFSMIPLLFREPEPIWLQECHLSKNVLEQKMPAWSRKLYGHEGVPESLGSAVTHLLNAQSLPWPSILYIWPSSLAVEGEANDTYFRAKNETQGFRNLLPPSKIKAMYPPECMKSFFKRKEYGVSVNELQS